MGIYLNQGNAAFNESVNKEIYVDKSLMIEKVFTDTVRKNKYICVSRPRRFGKSTDANMLVAFFSKGCNSHELFDNLKISAWSGYEKHMNKHNVIHINMQDFLSTTNSIEQMIEKLNKRIIRDLKYDFPNYCEETNLSDVLEEIFAYTNNSFIFVIDEWDCIFREFKENQDAQKKYLDYLRNLLKDKTYVELCYMTGILPIKKYGTHSALNMFDEISMLEQRGYSKFMGFTEEEVKELCGKYDVDYSKMQEWYNGYHIEDDISVYSPRSVTSAVSTKKFSNYWSQTETYEALKVYIDLNMDGLKDEIVNLLVGMKVDLDVSSFHNDMTTFNSKDDVLTLLVHLGYLGYDAVKQQVYIPNNEVKDIFVTSIKNSSWKSVTSMFKNANDLLKATWNLEEERVARYIQNAHYETSILQYNDENALSYTISLAYITAKEHYTIVRELPTGKGFADIAFIPKENKPAMLIELKYGSNVETGIEQIKDKQYFFGLEKYLDNLLLVSISYDKSTKEHQCRIEKY